MMLFCINGPYMLLLQKWTIYVVTASMDHICCYCSMDHICCYNINGPYMSLLLAPPSCKLICINGLRSASQLLRNLPCTFCQKIQLQSYLCKARMLGIWASLCLSLLTQMGCWRRLHKPHSCVLQVCVTLHQMLYPTLCMYDHSFQW